MSDELKPCPFCGETSLDHGPHTGGTFVQCLGHDCYGSAGTADQWNKRTTDPLLAEATEILDELANIPQLELWHDRIVALLEKINQAQPHTSAGQP